MTINGTVTKTAAQLPFSDFFDGTLNYAYSSPVSAGSDKQYALTTPVPTPASGFTVDSAVTITGTYKTQFKVTFAQSGIGVDSTGTVVTINGTVTKTAAQLPFSDFFDGTLNYAYSSPVSAGSDKQYVLTTPAATPASGFTVVGAVTVTGAYKTQYRLTLAITAGVPSGLANINGGTNNTFYDSGTPLSLTANTPISGVGGTGYVFANWSGGVPPPDPNGGNPLAITMNQARAITANYNTLVLSWDAANIFSAQYSDPTLLKAVLMINGSPAAAGSKINFAVGTDSGFAFTNGSGTALDMTKLTQAPGNYLASASCSALVCGVPLSISYTPYQIMQEDARAVYAGLMSFSTPSTSSSSAQVTLVATVQDITGVSSDPAYDTYAGDIRKARVSLVDRDSADAAFTGCGNLTPVLVDPSDPKTGVVSCTTTLAISGGGDDQLFTGGIVVNNYYTRDNSFDDFVVHLYKPGTGFLGGGGYLVNAASAGSYAGTTTARSNFGFNAKAKTPKVFQGHVNLIFRRLVGGVWKTYQIKSNAIDSLTINKTTASTGTGQFISKANLTDITDKLNPIGLGGGYQLQVTVTDNGEPGSSDKLAVTLWDGSVLLFSTNWSGTPPKTIEQTLGAGSGGGNLQAR